MPADRTKALLRGLGPIDEVAAQLANLPIEESVKSTSILNLSVQLQIITTNDNGRQIAALLLCSLLNEGFRKSCFYYTVDDNCRLTSVYVGDDRQREALADLMGV